MPKHKILMAMSGLILEYFSAGKTVLFLLILGSMSCRSDYQEALAGTWQGIKIEEEGQPLAGVDPDALKLVFMTDGKYQYFSTLNYREAGSFRVDFPYLYTMDTLQGTAEDKAVEILQLGEDSLSIKMNEEGKVRIVHFERIAQ